MTTTDLGRFLADYTAWLWGCGATCTRIEKNVRRIAAAYGYHIDITVMPVHVTVALYSPENENREIFSNRTAPCGINFDLNTRLSALSWAVSDARLPLEEAHERFDHIISRHYADGARILLLASLANACFCGLFKGDAMAMTIVLLATMAGYFLKQRLLRHKVDVRITFFVCAFVSAAICSGAMIFGWSDTPAICVATSVLYLIPGVPYLNATSDLIDRHYLCAFSRFMDAVVLTASLGAGLILAIFMMKIDMTW